jgi:PAS domain S-box-containing protein
MTADYSNADIITDQRVDDLKRITKLLSRDGFKEDLITEAQSNAFQNITEIASQICGTPAAMINFLDEEYQWTLFNVGWRTVKIPKEDSICQFTIEQDELLHISDTSQDYRLLDVQAIKDNSDIGFYAGINIKNKLGDKVGTLCVIDSKPRKLTNKQRKALKTLADEIKARLELIRSKVQLEQRNKFLVKTSRFLKNSTDIKLILHPDSLNIEEAFPEVQKIFGYSPEEMAGSCLTDFCPSKDIADSIKKWLEQQETEKLSIETDIFSKMGDLLCFSLQISRADNRLFVTGRDITERKEVEQQLQKEKKMLEGMIQNLPGIFCLIDVHGIIRRWNRNLETITGYTGNELMSSKINKYLLEDDIKIAFQKLGEVFKHERARNEFTIVSKDGKQIPFLISGFRLKIEDEFFAVVIGVNISEQKRMLRELNEKEERLSIALKRLENAQHIAKLGSWEWDSSEKNLYWSNETFELLNLDKDEVEPSNELINDLVHPDDRDKFSKYIKKALSGEEFVDFETNLVLSDNTIKHVYMRGEVYVDDGGKPLNIIGTIQDITAQKQVEQKLKKTLKEREVLLAEIHHRVKNNLAVVSGLIQIELMDIEDNQSIQVLSNSLTRIKSIALVHEKLYASNDFKNIQLETYVNDLLQSIKSKYQNGRDIRVETEIDDTKLNINLAISAGLLLNELITNAYKYAFQNSKSGVIHLKIESDDDEITMIVADNGVGLPDDFNPEDRSSIGFTLIDVLSKQLMAEYSVESDTGTRFTFIFKNRENTSGSSGNIFLS